MIAEQIIEHSYLANLTHGKSPLSDHLIKEAMEVIRTTPAPTTRTEAWKYTRVAKLTKKEYSENSSNITSITPYIIDDAAISIVFVNGHFQAQLSNFSSVNGLSIKSIKECSTEEL